MVFGHVPEWYEYGRRRKKYPVCAECGDEIQGEYRWEIGAECYCTDCARMLFEKINDEEE